MCTRFYVEPDTEEIREIIAEVQRSQLSGKFIKAGNAILTSGEIRPTNPSHRHALIIYILIQLVTSHDGIVVAAVPEGDVQIAVLGVNRLLLEVLSVAVRILSADPVSEDFGFGIGEFFLEAALDPAEEPSTVGFHAPFG